MLYQILILPAGSREAAGLPYGYYKDLANAKEALMEWARGVLALHPDKKYKEKPVDGRVAVKQVLRVEIAAPGEKAAITGLIVAHEFADEAEEGYSSRMHHICMDAIEAACNALIPGVAVMIPYDEDDEEGNNTTIRFWGRHGEVSADVVFLKKDDVDGNVVIEVVSENGVVEDLAPDDILDEDWPYLADVMLEQIREQQTPNA